MKVLLLELLIVAVSVNANAAKPSTSTTQFSEASCAQTDLSNRFGPVRNQGGAPWCSAFAAADYLSFYAHQRVSAFDVAVQTLTYQAKTETAPQTLGGLLTHSEKDFDPFAHQDAKDLENADALNRQRFPRTLSGVDGTAMGESILIYTHGPGLCTEDQLPSEIHTNSALANWGYLKNRLRQFEGVKPVPPSQEPDCENHSKLKPVREMIGVVNQKSIEAVKRQVDEKCKSRKMMPGISSILLKREDETDGRTIARSIAEGLAQHEPSFVSYDSCLADHNCKGSSKEADHSGVVVGMKWDSSTHQCFFKMRNSWGAGWKDCDKQTGKARGFESEPCQPGYFWVSESGATDRFFQAMVPRNRANRPEDLIKPGDENGPGVSGP